VRRRALTLAALSAAFALGCGVKGPPRPPFPEQPPPSPPAAQADGGTPKSP
jgi:hypothetical protein